jgi:hypothetical protein
LKKNIVNGLKRETSNLRKLIRIVKESDESTASLNDTKVVSNIAKCIEEKNYTRNDFANFNSNVIYDICRQLKISKNSKNAKSVYRICQKIFLETSSFSNFTITNIHSHGSEVVGELNMNGLKPGDAVNVLTQGRPWLAGIVEHNDGEHITYFHPHLKVKRSYKVILFP